MKKFIYALIICFISYAGPANVSIILCEEHNNSCCATKLEDFISNINYSYKDNEQFNACLKLRSLLAIIRHLKINKFYIFISWINFYEIFDRHKRFNYKVYKLQGKTQGKTQGISFNIQSFFCFFS